jgi:predicted hotdog family 3-hydroxylacyl-ACP dehydratase
MLNTQLNHTWIAEHIPHQYDMCLLEQVVSWDAQQIHCLAISHRSPDNPLRSRDQLSSACGIEYAAQAMAIHGALCASDASARPRSGFLISVRGTTLHTPRLDNFEHDLTIVANCIHSSADNVLYQFSIHAAEQLLLDGRAAVILNADNQLQNTGTRT